MMFINCGGNGIKVLNARKEQRLRKFENRVMRKLFFT
jgi:hypothetical protein